jgi:hypothetical protein
MGPANLTVTVPITAVMYTPSGDSQKNRPCPRAPSTGRSQPVRT